MVHPLLPRRRTLARFLAGLGALLLLYTVAGFVGVPAAIEWLAERLAPQKLGRELALGSVEFNPYSLVLEVRAAKLMEPGSGERFASFDALTVDLSWQSLARLAPVVQELRLNRPYVRLAREADGRLNVDDLPARFASAPSSSGPARFSLNNIQVEDGHIDFSDKQAGTVHAVADLKLSVPFLSSLPADVDIFVEPLLSARVDDSPVLLQGRARPFAGDKEAVLDLKLGAMDMTRYLAYLPLPARVKVAGARLEADLQASFRQPQGQAPALSLSGSAALKALRVQGPDGKPLLGFRELALQLRDAPVTGNRFQVAGLKLDGFQASLERGPDGQLNLQRLFGTVAPAGSEKPDGLLKAADADAAPSDTAPPDAAPYAAPFV
ncbi:MAG: AsmA family protein, partial [Noviherbaspirillum sp.]